MFLLTSQDHEKNVYNSAPKEQIHSTEDLSLSEGEIVWKERKSNAVTEISAKEIPLSVSRQTRKPVLHESLGIGKVSPKLPTKSSLSRSTTDDGVYDPNRYLDEIFDEYAATHQPRDISPEIRNVRRTRASTLTDGAEIELQSGTTPDDYSGIEFGEDPNYDAKWTCSFGEDSANEGNATTSASSEQEVLNDIIFIPRELT